MIAHLGIAADRAGFEQGLMLPCPGLIPLILVKCINMADQDPRLAAGPQPHIRLIELSGAGHGGQKMDHPLAQADVKLMIIDR